MIGANQTRDFLMSQFSWNKRDTAEADTVANVKTTNTKVDQCILRESDASTRVNLATIAHDISTPIGIIAGAAWSLNDGCNEEDQKFWIDCILRNVLSAQNLLEDFKDQERAESGRFVVNLQKIDLSEVVREAVEDFAPLAKDHPLKLYGDSAWILGDPERLKRLVFNLLSNAAKYSQAGREIKVDVWKRGTEVCLFVQDQGRGIKPNEIEQMFLPFTRLETDRYNTQGDGLGLCSVKRIADAHGAAIKVQGTAGQGSIFEVSFKALEQFD